MVLAKIYLKVQHCWLYNVLHVYTSHITILQNSLDKTSGTVVDIVEFRGVDPRDVDNLKRDILNSKYVERVEELFRNDNILILRISSKACPLYPILSYESRTFVKEDIMPNGDIEFTLETAGSKRLDILVDRITRETGDITVKGVKIYKKSPDVSIHQENIVRLALELGYYDVPKKINLKKLSEITNLSVSTINEVLRRGEKNIISKYFSEQKRQRSIWD